MSAEDFDQICERLGIPEASRKHIAVDSPLRGKIAVAKGMLPMAPKVLLAMMYVLVGDPDPKVKEAAEAGIVGMPAERLVPLLDSDTHPKILEFLAYRRSGDDRLMEKVVLLRQINDKSICYLAETASERIAEMIGNNQERLVITPVLLRFLQRNERVGKALVERVATFQRLLGVNVAAVTDEERVLSEAAQRRMAEQRAEAARPEQPVPGPTAALAEPAWEPQEPPGSPRSPPLPDPDTEGDGGARSPAVPWSGSAGEVALPPDFVPGEVYIPAPAAAVPEPVVGLQNPLAALLADWGIPFEAGWLVAPYVMAVAEAWPAPPPAAPGTPLFEAGPAPAAIVAPTRSLGADVVDTTGLTSIADSDFAFGFDESSDDFGTEFTEDRDSVDEGEKLTLQQAISKMTTGKKIKLAYKGNKTVREILIRDSNKIVSCAVVKGGRLTDNEVMSVASNRAIHEDVIRLLADNKEFLRKYPVKLALCGNPKTPIPVAMGLLSSLHLSDLRTLSNNRNVSSAVFSTANKMVKARQQ